MSPNPKNKEKKRASGRKARLKIEQMKIGGTNSGQTKTYSDSTFAKHLLQLQNKS